MSAVSLRSSEAELAKCIAERVSALRRNMGLFALAQERSATFADTIRSIISAGANQPEASSVIYPADITEFARTARLVTSPAGGVDGETHHVQRVGWDENFDARFGCTLRLSRHDRDATIVCYDFLPGGGVGPHYVLEDEMLVIVSGEFEDPVSGSIFRERDSVLYAAGSHHALRTSTGGRVVVRWTPSASSRDHGVDVLRVMLPAGDHK